IFLKRVECGFKEIQSGMEEIRQLNDPFTGTISVAFLLTLGFNFLPDIIGKFNRQYPNVQFRLYQNATPFILKALYSGEVDFCFVGPFDRQPGAVWHQLMIEELFVYLPVEHPLAGRKSLDLKELAAEPFISLKRSYGMRTLMEQFAREAGFIPAIRFEGDDVATVMGLVSCGLGVTLLPTFTSYDSSKVVRISVTSPRCQRAIGLAWLDGRTFSRSAELFRDFAIEQFK
ncbi:MAG TPA: LysR substrate-binding domain-containing protein, partial [Bacillota bacterium]|nr:LysR substrate-binding domain-containing protein [Bacillota bacterium]